MDPLSDALSLIKPRSYRFGGFDVGGDWSIHFGQHQGIKCYAVASGECWLSVEGVPDAVHVKTGDCFLLPRGRQIGRGLTERLGRRPPNSGGGPFGRTLGWRLLRRRQ